MQRAPTERRPLLAPTTTGVHYTTCMHSTQMYESAVLMTYFNPLTGEYFGAQCLNSLYLRKVPSNHILMDSSLVVEYFSTKIVAMVTVSSHSV